MRFIFSHIFICMYVSTYPYIYTHTQTHRHSLSLSLSLSLSHTHTHVCIDDDTYRVEKDAVSNPIKSVFLKLFNSKDSVSHQVEWGKGIPKEREEDRRREV